MKRYFIAFYQYEVGGKSGAGNVTMWTCGVYPKGKELMEAIAESSGWEDPKIVFTNIIELSESDHGDWISG